MATAVPEVKDTAKTESTALRALHSDCEPYEKGFLTCGQHKIYWEQSGNPNGKPIIILHGGPGAGSAGWYRSFCESKHWRIVQFDQRGCGQSTPHASVDENTTWDLVADIEKIRTLLKIEKWVVFGGSWGSTLALSYAQKHKEHVKALVLRGIFCLREKELRFFYQEGANFLYPDAWEEFLAPIPEVERGHLMSAYWRRLNGTDEKVKLQCAIAWTAWEMRTGRLLEDPKAVQKAREDHKFALAFARIECHYFVNGGFFEKDGQLINNVGLIKDIPAVIVQGRYDVVCPMITAWDLHKAWPGSELKVIQDAGHSAKEPGIVSELVKAVEKYKDL
jgi:proline iminopeptidase